MDTVTLYEKGMAEDWRDHELDAKRLLLDALQHVCGVECALEGKLYFADNSYSVVREGLTLGSARG